MIKKNYLFQFDFAILDILISGVDEVMWLVWVNDLHSVIYDIMLFSVKYVMIPL